MAFVYAYPGPPFNWLGTHTKTQHNAFTTWVNARTGNFTNIKVFYQIRAQQFRKMAGLLEAHYAAEPTPLKPTFQKPIWQPGPQGHWVGAPRFDHLPMVYTGQIKDYMQPQFEHDDEAVFLMNHLRTLIERHEDEAQYANDGMSVVTTAMQKLTTLFTQPEYQLVLVDDIGALYQGQPYGRVNAFDVPTQWELEQHAKTPPGSHTVQLTFTDTDKGQA